jgi:heme-degrading monooxygenase HmoA
VICRTWNGWTTPDDADAYEHVVSTEVLPGIAAMGISGFRGVHLLRRDLEDEVEFTTLIWFDSIDSVRDFMGDDCSVAHVPPNAQAVLSRWDDRADHHEVRMTPDELF